MNKKKLLALILVIFIAVLFSSCKLGDSTAEAKLVGIWEFAGTTDSYSEIHYEFKNDGSARMIGNSITDEGNGATLNWYADEYHLEINDIFLYYSVGYVYELSADENTLTLYCTAEGVIDAFYDGVEPGDRIVFTRSSETFLSNLEEDDSSTYPSF